MVNGQMELVVKPILDSQEEYQDILKKYALREYKLGQEEAVRLVELSGHLHADKGIRDFIKGVKTKAVDSLFATLRWTEDDLLESIFIASERTLSRVSQQIREILSDGYKSGMGIDKVARDIRERYDQLKDWESVRIARTEIHTSHNQGVMHTYDELGVEYTQWIAHIDKRTRPSHGGMTKGKRGGKHATGNVNREIIRMGDTYSNGLAYPGDKSGPIEEWINCRCSNAPFVMPYGYTAPPNMKQFKESDLVKVSVPNTQELLDKVTNPQPKQPTAPKIEAKGIDVGNILDDVLDKYGLSEKPKTKKPKTSKKPKQPEVKVNIEKPKPKPKVDVDDILGGILDEYGLSDKPKKKPKKKKTTSKPKKATAPKEISIEQHLRNELPKDFDDKAIDYLSDKIRRRANAKQEYGQIFDYKTGRNTSPEFKGGKHSVRIKEKDWIKPLREFTQEEMVDALSNRAKYEKSYVDKSKTLASIHNHPSDGSRAFSGADIFGTATNKWEDYGIAISDKELWISEYKGRMSDLDAKTIEKKIDRLFSKSKNQAQKIVMADYDDLPYKEKRDMESEILKDVFGDNLLELFDKNKEWGIKVKRVRYA